MSDSGISLDSNVDRAIGTLNGLFFSMRDQITAQARSDGARLKAIEDQLLEMVETRADARVANEGMLAQILGEVQKTNGTVKQHTRDLGTMSDRLKAIESEISTNRERELIRRALTSERARLAAKIITGATIVGGFLAGSIKLIIWLASEIPFILQRIR